MANTYKALSTVTVGAGGAASIDFTNIPQTYTDLMLMVSARGGTSGAIQIYFNNSTATDKSWRRLYDDGSSVFSDSNSASSYVRPIGLGRTDFTASTFGNLSVYIPNYASTTVKKSVSADGVNENNATAAEKGLLAGLWDSTSAITQITLIPTTSTFVQYSTATLYGVFNADVSSAPATPTIGTATAGAEQASITFTPVSNAASYTMTSTPGSITATGTSSPIVVTGLTAGTAYTFKVKSNNPFGSSAESAASNSVTPTAPAPSTVEYLVVAGGGGGGVNNLSGDGGRGGGGGGAGGYRTASGFAVSTGVSYTITVGGGGAGGTTASDSASTGANGNDSVFSTITSTKGGGGQGHGATGLGPSGGSGGSGGGAASFGSYGNGNTPSTTPSQGNRGGSFSSRGAGGGGGIGAIGGTGSESGGAGIGGNGGAGTTSSISGSSVGYAGGGGGAGVGGNGSASNGGGAGGGTAGTANTGGGGGANNYASGGAGGSGVVIIRYPDNFTAAASTTGSPTVTVSGGYRIYRWTGSGSITF